MTAAIAPQAEADGFQWDDDAEAIHRWYRIIMGFDWKLADFIIDMLGVKPGSVVVDPFSGAGTTLVQCKKRGVSAVGIDVNPVCILASKVKTHWILSPAALQRQLADIVRSVSDVNVQSTVNDDSALRYLRKSGMIERGWLSLHKAKIVLALRAAIGRLRTAPEYKQFFYVALMSAVVGRIADVKFGPEIYCVEPRKLPALGSFVELAEAMIADMVYAKRLLRPEAASEVFFGDSRSPEIFREALPRGADYAITSPPYPNEHDYTRSTRLELVVLGHVRDIEGLRKIKRDMVRCTTKGLYKDDSDAMHAASFPYIEKIARSLDSRAKDYTDGFSQLYGRMVRSYFGGMSRHLQAIKTSLKPGGRCAYVVRDTRTLLGKYIDTPGLLAKIATSSSHGFLLEDIIEWKKVKGTTGTYHLSEKIIVFRKPR